MPKHELSLVSLTNSCRLKQNFNGAIYRRLERNVKKTVCGGGGKGGGLTECDPIPFSNTLIQVMSISNLEVHNIVCLMVLEIRLKSTYIQVATIKSWLNKLDLC